MYAGRTFCDRWHESMTAPASTTMSQSCGRRWSASNHGAQRNPLLTLRLPFESRYSSSPRSTRIMILSVWLIEMLLFSWLVLTLSLVEQSGSCSVPSRCQGPIGSNSEGVSSARQTVSFAGYDGQVRLTAG